LAAVVLATVWLSPCAYTGQSLCRVAERLCHVLYTHDSYVISGSGYLQQVNPAILLHLLFYIEKEYLLIN
jgi:hypothetical protein